MSDAPPPDPSPNSDYRSQFLQILNNEGKQHRSGDTGYPVRKNGFVVLVRGGSNLQPIESLCFEQTYNQCLTARYRLQPQAAIGTLIAAHLKDLQRIAEGGKDVAGALAPPDSEDSWRRMATTYLAELTSFSKIRSLSIDPSFTEQQGFVYPDHLKLAFEILGHESVIGTGHRLVLLGELSEATDVREWEIAFEMLFKQLPERVGIVLSGAPEDFFLPKNDPHFLEITLPDTTPADPQSAVAYKYTDSSFHRDEPASRDQLDVNDYANALGRFIVHPQTLPPLTIGINGRWGRGKSSFMRLVDSALVKYADVNRHPQPPHGRWSRIKSASQRFIDRALSKYFKVNRNPPATSSKSRLEEWDTLLKEIIALEKIQPLTDPQNQTEEEKELKQRYDTLTAQENKLWQTMRKEATRNVIGVTFNAWQFEDAKQTWAGLASQISERMEAALPWPARLWLRFTYAWNERKTELILNLLLPLAVVCLVAPLVILGSIHIKTTPDSNDPLGTLLRILLPAGSALLTIWFVSLQILKVTAPVSQRVLSYVSMPDYREQMGFQHRVKDDLKFVTKFLNKRLRGCRVVVYIDDLDRCSEHKIMELLQAINLILASCEFFVFVGMDTEMIYRAIKSYYKETPTERSPDSYLRKIVQISFYLPEIKPKTRVTYLDTLFSPKARRALAGNENGQAGQVQQKGPVAPSAAALSYDLKGVLPIVSVKTEEVEDTADELHAFRDYNDFLDDNPREIKRLINIHRLIKILLQKQNPSREWQRKLVKWLIFCDRWPDLVDDILVLKKEKPAAVNCLGDLADSLEKLNLHPVGTGKIAPFAELQRFASFVNEGKGAALDVLSAQDIDDDFRLAAYLSQLVSKSPALPEDRPRAQGGAEPVAQAPAVQNQAAGLMSDKL